MGGAVLVNFFVVIALLLGWFGATAVVAQASGSAPAPAEDPNEGPSIRWYQAHGWLLWLAFGVFIPVGILLSRYGQYRLKWWFEAHLVLQILGVITSTIGVAIGLNKFDSLHDHMTHTKLGLAIMVLVWVQVVLSIIRPKRGQVSRVPWYFIHWLFGTASVLLAWYNIFKGLDLYVEGWTVGTQKDLYVLFSLNVAILGFAYLFLDRFNHLMNQAKEQNVVHPNAQYPLGKQGKPNNLQEAGVQVQSTNGTSNV
ncbi:unnamed protein product [Sphagnum jensenii]|jgi:hypothetical protein|uniref:Cytochrome b561 domain-containing protein n=1 Tax=Sphagnum jensenii TaxID=128206 RepID=A0ABP0W708_9BRYO